MNQFLLEREGAKVKVILVAELTSAVVPELLCAVEEDGVREVVLDCAKTMLVDSAGLSLLLAARNSFSQPPRILRLVGVQPSLFSVLETLRLHRYLNAQME
jgi:anti-anti-sigma factor